MWHVLFCLLSGDTQTALQESHQTFIGSYRYIARLVNDTRITTSELKGHAIITLQSSVTWHEINELLMTYCNSEGSGNNVIIGFWPVKGLLQNLGNSLAAGKYRICYWELSWETSTTVRTYSKFNDIVLIQEHNQRIFQSTTMQAESTILTDCIRLLNGHD